MAFLCLPGVIEELQRIYISDWVIKIILRFSTSIVIICSLIEGICLLYHWVTWDDIYYFLERASDKSNKMSSVTFFLTYSIIAWVIVFIIGLLHLFFSYMNCQWAEKSGYGLLNIHCLITKKAPSVFLTTIQDTALCAATFHFSVVGTDYQRMVLIGSFLVLVLPTLMANKIFLC